MFAVLDVRNFASSQLDFSIPLLKVRNNIFASSQFLNSPTKSNVTQKLPKMLNWLFDPCKLIKKSSLVMLGFTFQLLELN